MSCSASRASRVVCRVAFYGGRAFCMVLPGTYHRKMDSIWRWGWLDVLRGGGACSNEPSCHAVQNPAICIVPMATGCNPLALGNMVIACMPWDTSCMCSLPAHVSACLVRSCYPWKHDHNDETPTHCAPCSCLHAKLWLWIARLPTGFITVTYITSFFTELVQLLVPAVCRAGVCARGTLKARVVSHGQIGISKPFYHGVAPQCFNYHNCMGTSRTCSQVCVHKSSCAGVLLCPEVAWMCSLH